MEGEIETESVDGGTEEVRKSQVDLGKSRGLGRVIENEDS